MRHQTCLQTSSLIMASFPKRKIICEVINNRSHHLFRRHCNHLRLRKPHVLPSSKVVDLERSKFRKTNNPKSRSSILESNRSQNLTQPRQTRLTSNAEGQKPHTNFSAEYQTTQNSGSGHFQNPIDVTEPLMTFICADAEHGGVDQHRIESIIVT